MKILVTGGAGFIGSHLADQLIKKGHRLTIIDNLSTGKREFVNPKAKFYQLDINQAKAAEVFLIVRPEIVFHLAAQKSVSFSLKSPGQDAQTNILGALNTIESSLKARVKKFIFISTGGAIYGQTKLIPTPETSPAGPNSPYGLSKLAIDNYLKYYYSRVKKLNYVSLRLANVYGPRQDAASEAGVVALFVSNLLKNKRCLINGSGNQTRDFIYVDDVVSACLKSISSGRGIYNIGTGIETSINSLYSLIASLIIKKEISHRPVVSGEVFRSALKTVKAKKELGWSKRIDLAAGVKKTINYFQSI